MFLGRAYVEEALARGHHVTTFNRGRSGSDLPGVEALRGDRTKDLDRLRGRAYDAVLDTSGLVPRDVLAAARVLEPAVGAYAFVSSVSASAGWPAAPSGEEEPAYECAADAGPEDGDYGTLKAGCERAVQEVFGPDRSLLLRPGLSLGPYENVGRLPWWLLRIAEGGRVPAPGDPARPMQLIDARDIAVFTLDLLERGAAGLYNVTGPAGNATYGSWLGDCVAVTGSGAELVWVPGDVLLAHCVPPWTGLPLWMPADGSAAYAWRVDTARAQAAGLRTRPMTETVRDTWYWLARGGRPLPPRPGLPPLGIDQAKEQAILAAVAARGR